MKNAGRVLLNPARDLVAVQRLVFEHHQDGELRAAAFDRITQRCHGVLYIGYLYMRCQGLWLLAAGPLAGLRHSKLSTRPDGRKSARSRTHLTPMRLAASTSYFS